MAKRPSTVKLDFASIGASGINTAGGFIRDDYLPELNGVDAYRAYRRMSDNDPTVGALLLALTLLLRGAEWTVQAAGTDGESEVAKEFLEQVIDDMDFGWTSVIAEVCSMFPFGFSVLEILWKRRDGIGSAHDDGKIGVRSLALRRQDTCQRWDIDETTGLILGVWQYPPNGAAVYIPWEKMLLFRTTEAANNPEGRSILRNAYRPWHHKQRIEDVEGVGVERNLAGMPMVRIPASYMAADADPDEKSVFQSYQTLVRNIRRDIQEGVILPSDRDSSGNYLFDLTLMSAAGAGADTGAIIERYDRQIATSVLADFLFLGQSAVGSFALSSDKTDLFAAAVGVFADSIQDTFNRHFVPRLMMLNGYDRGVWPRMQHGDIETPDLAALSSFISSLAAAGMPVFPDREVENHLRKVSGLPLAPDEGADDDFATPDPALDGEQP